MTHAFPQIGDTHLARGERNTTKRAALEQILSEGSARPNLAAFIWPGDLNDSLMSIDDRNFLADYIQRLTQVAPLVIVPGNHDAPGDLNVFVRLRTTWPVHLITHPAVIVINTATGAKAAIFGFPYPSRMGLVAAGTPAHLISHAAREALDAIFTPAAAELAAAPTNLRIMAAHVNIGGSRTCTGQPSIGKEIELDPNLLGRLGDIPKLLNHIHLAQDIAGAIYAGSICGMDFGERDRKTYPVLEMDDADGSYVIYRNPLNVPRLFVVDGVLTRDGFKWWINESDSGHPTPSFAYYQPPDGGWEGTEVSVRYRFAAAERDVLDFSLVTAPFVGAIRIQPDPIPTHTRAVRAPEVADAQTDDAKVAAYVRGAGQDWTPSLEHKFALLQQPDGAAFLTELEREVTGRRGESREAFERDRAGETGELLREACQ